VPDRGFGDFRFYDRVANLLASGQGMVDPFSHLANPPPTAAHPPGWPLVLALVSELGGTSSQAHRIAGCLVGVALIVAVGALGRRVAGERAGLLAAALAALNPLLIQTDESLMSESLFGLAIALVLLLGYRVIDRPGAARFALLGAAIGAAALVRTEALLLLVLLAAPLALRLHAGLGGAAALGAAVLVLAPWTIRNAAAFDAFVPVSTNGGSLLAGANCALTYRGGELGSWTILCVPHLRGGEVAASRALQSRGRRYASGHASRLPLVAAVRVLRTWDLYRPWRQAELAEFGEGKDRRLGRAGLFYYYAECVLAVVGAVCLRRRGTSLLVLLAPIVAVTLTSVLAYGTPRLRQPAEISLAVLAAAALDAWWPTRKSSPGPAADGVGGACGRGQEAGPDAR
jgi:hypothetical protein